VLGNAASTSGSSGAANVTVRMQLRDPLGAHNHTWAGEKSLGGVCLYLYVISFDFDSGVGIPVSFKLFGLGG